MTSTESTESTVASPSSSTLLLILIIIALFMAIVVIFVVMAFIIRKRRPVGFEQKSVFEMYDKTIAGPQQSNTSVKTVSTVDSNTGLPLSNYH